MTTMDDEEIRANKLEAQLVHDRINRVCGTRIGAPIWIKGVEFESDVCDVPRHPNVVKEVLDILPTVKTDAVAEMLIRYLAGCKFPFDGSELIRRYDQSANELFRWAIANTINTGRAMIPVDWLRTTMLGPAIGCEKQMMYDALPRYLPKREAREIIEKIFDEQPIHAISALLRIRDPKSIPFLESKAQIEPYKSDRWYQKRIAIVVEKIRNRPRSPKELA